MVNMSAMQVAEHIFNRCKSWWDIYRDMDKSEVWNHRSQLDGLIAYFREQNNRYVHTKDAVLWTELDVMLGECEVALDGMDLEEDIKPGSEDEPTMWDCFQEHVFVVSVLVINIGKYVVYKGDGRCRL